MEEKPPPRIIAKPIKKPLKAAPSAPSRESTNPRLVYDEATQMYVFPSDPAAPPAEIGPREPPALPTSTTFLASADDLDDPALVVDDAAVNASAATATTIASAPSEPLSLTGLRRRQAAQRPAAAEAEAAEPDMG